MTAHKHAALMAQYAQDAAETDTPWERWEWKRCDNKWCQMSVNPGWATDYDYRRKPDSQKTEPRIYECWEDLNGELHHTCIGAKMNRIGWRRVPGLDKTGEVLL
jgi:hypothetical protein